ncbi:MAG TPA: hypothetical protein VLX56_05685 [Nitrososphaerales archaeon]|nr:hypothetical protein [Nitrososphaerales archaeon]
MNNNYDRAFLIEHIAYLGREVSGIQQLIPIVTKLRDDAKKEADAIPKNTRKFENFATYSIWTLQFEIQEAMLHSLESSVYFFKEFAQMWEQHRLLSEYVDVALGEVSDEIRTEFHRKVKDAEERFRNDPVRLGILAHLEKLKENKAKYQGGPGDI